MKGTFYSLRNLSDIYRTSNDNTVNKTSKNECECSGYNFLNNNKLIALSSSKENSKNCAVHDGAKMSDDTVNDTVNSEALGKISILLDSIKANPGCRANALAKMMGKGLRTV